MQTYPLIQFVTKTKSKWTLYIYFLYKRQLSPVLKERFKIKCLIPSSKTMLVNTDTS